MLHEKKLPIAPLTPRQSLLGKDKSRKKDLLGLLFSSPPLHPLQGKQDIGRLLLADFGESLWVVVRGQSVTGVNSTASLKKQEWDGDGWIFAVFGFHHILSSFSFLSFFSAALLLQMAEEEPPSLQQISCVSSRCKMHAPEPLCLYRLCNPSLRFFFRCHTCWNGILGLGFS
jgi:hypothetical protein